MEFDRARRNATLSRVLGAILSRPAALVPLAEAKDGRAYTGQVRRSLQQVCLARIAGSVNRARDFDRSFNPLTDVTRQRWERIDKAFHEGVVLPPVSLQKIADTYFVVDGHHRISVARLHGAAFIDAEVIEIVCGAQDAT